MTIRCLLLMPGESLARRFDEGYARFIGRMRRRIKRGNRRLALYSRLAYAEHALPFAVGLMASYFGFVIVVPLVLCIYPLWSIGDTFIWRRIYKQLAKGLGYRASFLVNLDMLYWFALGWVVGWILILITVE